jgi:hypothetical protein
MGEVLRTARDIVDVALQPKQELLIHNGNLPSTAESLRDLLGTSNRLFERGVPVRLVRCCPRMEACAPPTVTIEKQVSGAAASRIWRCRIILTS